MQTYSYKPPFVNILHREVNKRVRYYSIRVYKTLFGEYLVENSYGSLKNKRATGVIQEYFQTLDDALVASNKKVEQKLKKGYNRYE